MVDNDGWSRFFHLQTTLVGQQCLQWDRPVIDIGYFIIALQTCVCVCAPWSKYGIWFVLIHSIWGILIVVVYIHVNSVNEMYCWPFSSIGILSPVLMGPLHDKGLTLLKPQAFLIQRTISFPAIGSHLNLLCMKPWFSYQKSGLQPVARFLNTIWSIFTNYWLSNCQLDPWPCEKCVHSTPVDVYWVVSPPTIINQPSLIYCITSYHHIDDIKVQMMLTPLHNYVCIIVYRLWQFHIAIENCHW